MGADSAATSEHQGGEIMASVDGNCLVIADLDRDDAWIEMSVGDAAPLGEWR